MKKIQILIGNQALVVNNLNKVNLDFPRGENLYITNKGSEDIKVTFEEKEKTIPPKGVGLFFLNSSEES